MRLIAVSAMLAVSLGARMKMKVKSQVPWSSVKTALGCSCTTACKVPWPSDDHCDTCRTPKGCGRKSWRNFYWDYCVYPADSSRIGDSAKKKLDRIWSEVVQSGPTRVSEWGFPLDARKWSVQTTFDNHGNLPPGRPKVIHTFGSICTVKWEKPSSSLTGMFAGGTDVGLARVGLAEDLSEEGTTPGWGFKFPRSKVHDADVTVMFSTVKGQPFNLFRNNVTNHIPPAKGLHIILAKIFEQATRCSSWVGLSDFARYDSSGKMVSRPNFPFKLMMIPKAQMSNNKAPDWQTLARSLSKSVRSGTPIFDVYACMKPGRDEMNPGEGGLDNCGQKISLGTITTTSDFQVSSDYGDQKFFIRHQRIEEDWALKSEYERDARRPCGRSESDWKKSSPPRCPMRQ